MTEIADNLPAAEEEVARVWKSTDPDFGTLFEPGVRVGVRRVAYKVVVVEEVFGSCWNVSLGAGHVDIDDIAAEALEIAVDKVGAGLDNIDPGVHKHIDCWGPSWEVVESPADAVGVQD